jgi:Rrf2 family transcriptional regulator, nitric oxide-sensitive transcriptional repressor
MRLTSYSDYAFRMLVFLAVAPDRKGTVGQIAQAYGLSQNHLAKVSQHLVRRGLVTSTTGRNGGLRLAVDPETVTVGDVVRAAEEDVAVVECLRADNACRVSGSCAAQSTFAQAVAAFFAVLDAQTLADAARDEAGLRRALSIIPLAAGPIA